MTQKEKIELLKSTITFLYEKEGRSKSYIARLLEVDRKTLILKINEWNLTQNKSRKHLSPSNQKFANKHRQFIKSKLDKDITHKEIADELGVTLDFIKNIIYKDDILSESNRQYSSRRSLKAERRKQELMNKSSFDYEIKDQEGEEWKEILGYKGYYISNHGRVKSYVKSYNAYKLLSLIPNKNNGRLYVYIQDKGLQVSRLVGFAFLEGHSETNNTIDHIDGDVSNNKAINLQWVSQSINNKRAYDNLNKKVNIAYSRNGKFKKIIVDNKYEFKTIRSFAAFCNVSETQAQRYISGETKYKYSIKLIY